MVQQLMREGNIRSRLRKESPMGLMARTTWRCSFTLSIKKLYMDRGVASIFRPYMQRNTELWRGLNEEKDADLSSGYHLHLFNDLRLLVWRIEIGHIPRVQNHVEIFDK